VDLLSGTEQQQRWARAESVKARRGLNLPRLADWNYDACDHHETPTPSCEWRACGFEPFAHQTVSATFHYLARKSIDASQTGTGKTNSILLTLCLAKHYGEPLKAVLVVPTSAVGQWGAEIARFAPGLRTATVMSGMRKDERLHLYAARWEVLVIGFHLMTRDIDALEALRPAQVVSDDVDPILQTANKTHRAMVRLTKRADRVIVANATNLQTRLNQLYAATVPIGGREVWGSPDAFEKRYVKREPVFIHTRDSRGRRSRTKVLKTTGYKNLADFKAKFTPMMIRHRYDDLADLRIPDIVTENVYLDLHPAQRAKYELLQAGVLDLRKKDMPPQQKQVTAGVAWNHGQAICAGLAALGEDDLPGTSSKFDWTVEHVVGEWTDQKVVVYAKNQGSIRALQKRFSDRGVAYATIWGPERDSAHREAEKTRFWQDPACRVMIISAAGERSLNLQNASILVSIDLNLNPARVMQLLGRIRRAGSAHSRVFAFSLLAVDTQEERYMTSLASRQALFDHVHDEDSGDLFERLEPDVLLRLISP
jgi:hypothetical protein